MQKVAAEEKAACKISWGCDTITAGFQALEVTSRARACCAIVWPPAPPSPLCVSFANALQSLWCITVGFQKVLEASSGKYCVGDEITMADIYLPPMVFNANRWEVDMSAFPVISRLCDELAKHPAFEAAAPDNCPDAQ
jgi:hypothetical protein